MSNRRLHAGLIVMCVAVVPSLRLPLRDMRDLARPDRRSRVAPEFVARSTRRLQALPPDAVLFFDAEGLNEQQRIDRFVDAKFLAAPRRVVADPRIDCDPYVIVSPGSSREADPRLVVMGALNEELVLCRQR